MQFSNHSGRAQRGGIVYLAVDAIAPSAVQPRQNFPPAQLEELSRSIAEYGVLSPLTVRPRPDADAHTVTLEKFPTLESVVLLSRV